MLMPPMICKAVFYVFLLYVSITPCQPVDSRLLFIHNVIKQDKCHKSISKLHFRNIRLYNRLLDILLGLVCQLGHFGKQHALHELSLLAYRKPMKTKTLALQRYVSP